MKKIRFIGWEKGMKKIDFIHLLNEHGKLSLIEAKKIKDQVVDGLVIELVLDDDHAEIVLAEAKNVELLSNWLITNSSVTVDGIWAKEETR